MTTRPQSTDRRVTDPAPSGRSDLVLGIDAGNTKTIALIADTQGRVLGWGRAGSSNIYVSKPRALLALDQAVLAAQRSAGLSAAGAGSFAAVTLSATGADWPEDFEYLEALLQQRGWSPRLRVVNDAVGALRAGTLQGTGVAVACGTSAGIAARSPGGAVWHSSYWQEPEGANELAKHTLRAVYRAELGIDPPTSLTERVLAYYAQGSVESLLHSLTRRDRRPPRRVGRLARILLDEAEAGDETSLKIVCKHGRALGDYALAAARRVGLSGAYSLVTSGGVMRHRSRTLIRALMDRVQATHPQVQWQASRHEPVFGALLLALEDAGRLVDDAVMGGLEATCPDESLFLT